VDFLRERGIEETVDAEVREAGCAQHPFANGGEVDRTEEGGGRGSHGAITKERRRAARLDGDQGVCGAPTERRPTLPRKGRRLRPGVADD
jgi:hypothetical protein